MALEPDKHREIISTSYFATVSEIMRGKEKKTKEQTGNEGYRVETTSRIFIIPVFVLKFKHSPHINDKAGMINQLLVRVTYDPSVKKKVTKRFLH